MIKIIKEKSRNYFYIGWHLNYMNANPENDVIIRTLFFTSKKRAAQRYTSLYKKLDGFSLQPRNLRIDQEYFGDRAWDSGFVTQYYKLSEGENYEFSYNKQDGTIVHYDEYAQYDPTEAIEFNSDLSMPRIKFVSIGNIENLSDELNSNYNLFRLEHEREINKTGDGPYYLVYEPCIKNIPAHVEFYRRTPGFMDYKDDFYIRCLRFDELYWPRGFLRP